MRNIIIAALIGTTTSLRVRKESNTVRKWVELPNCPDTLKKGKDVALEADLSNATWATCKVKKYPPEAKPIGTIDNYVWSPV